MARPIRFQYPGACYHVIDRVMRAFELAEDGRGRRAYVAWLEARAGEDGRKVLESPTTRSALQKLRKGDERKVLLAAVLRQRTLVGLKWISEKLVMGHPGSVSRLIGGIAKNRDLSKKLEELEKC